jgi:predicted RNase H-like HicB family nuclease
VTFRVDWSDDDQEFVGTCDEYPSLSWLAATEAEALDGIKALVADADQ